MQVGANRAKNVLRNMHMFRPSFHFAYHRCWLGLRREEACHQNIHPSSVKMSSSLQISYLPKHPFSFFLCRSPGRGCGLLRPAAPGRPSVLQPRVGDRAGVRGPQQGGLVHRRRLGQGREAARPQPQANHQVSKKKKKK